MDEHRWDISWAKNDCAFFCLHELTALWLRLCSIQRIFQECDIQTVHRSKKSAVEKGVMTLAAEWMIHSDVLGVANWRKNWPPTVITFHGELHDSFEVACYWSKESSTSDFIQVFRKADNPAGAASRHPITRKIHYRGITCSGLSEEWCVDGHEKIALQMGILVWGIIDKFSRMELGLWAVPNAQDRNVPAALFLYTIKKFGGE